MAGSSIKTSFTSPPDTGKNNESIYAKYKTALKETQLKTVTATFYMRIVYASVAGVLAVCSAGYWIYFTHCFYKPQIHSDSVFISVTTACTINFLAAFVSIAKGLFSKDAR